MTNDLLTERNWIARTPGFMRAAFLAVFVTGCGSQSPTAPTAPVSPPKPPWQVELAGTWSGQMNVSDPGGNRADTIVVLEKTDSGFAGTWAWLPEGNDNWNYGTASATKAGDEVVLVLRLRHCDAITSGTQSGDALSLQGDGFRGDKYCSTTPISVTLKKD
jgi:hypothetical protein